MNSFLYQGCSILENVKIPKIIVLIHNENNFVKNNF